MPSFILFKGVLKMELESIGKWCFTGIATITTALLGNWDIAIQMLFIVMGLDILTGVVNGVKDKNFTSKRLRQGIGTKALYLIIIILCYQLDLFIGNGTPIFRTGACYLYVFVESTSIVENIGKAGVPLPKKLVEVLASIRGKSGGIATKEDFENLKEDKGDK